MPKSAEKFFENPILNSPYERPSRHWELDKDGTPTGKIADSRRKTDFASPIPRTRRHHGRKGADGTKQGVLAFTEGLSTENQEYLKDRINQIRGIIDDWRKLPEAKWGVTPTTARLLKHWRSHKFSDRRPFFCQVEAAETLIWLSEVAPLDPKGKEILKAISASNRDVYGKNAAVVLNRIALKLATGAGKTTVMAMIIAWQTLNAKRSPGSKLFTRGFLICTPGITIRDRLRVLLPNDPESYYRTRELVPVDMLETMNSADIVITNFHAFKQRELLELSAGARALLKGRTNPAEIQSLETEGQMLHRVMPNLLAHKHVLIINDEAHHCYRHRAEDEEEEDFDSSEDKNDAEKRNEEARIWISGIESLCKKLKGSRVVDLSATPFFLRGSGYAEGTLFPWTVSDFSLFDALECGIVKLPRVPVDQDSPIPEDGLPEFRNIWKHIADKMPKAGRTKKLDPAQLPQLLMTAIEALYGQYKKVFENWKNAGHKVPPCFIFICNNTSVSKLIYDCVAGSKLGDGSAMRSAACKLFSNYDNNGNPFPRPRTLLIDSAQLESGGEISKDFKTAAQAELDAFRRQREARGEHGEIDDAAILREAMNTVGKPGTLGADIRCVVSVSMLTEGWDANNVTHILGVRAFGTQLLCEQVVGRALRRRNYELNENGLFDVEYADIFGVPFDFTANAPVVVPPAAPPPPRIVVKALSPERNNLEIVFPRIAGYRRTLPSEHITAVFDKDSKLTISAEEVGPTDTLIAGIIGKEEHITLETIKNRRLNSVIYWLTAHILSRDPLFLDGDNNPKLFLFGDLKKIVAEWVEKYLICPQDHKALVCYVKQAERARTIIARCIRPADNPAAPQPIEAVPAYEPQGTTALVHFSVPDPAFTPANRLARSNKSLFETRKSHVNYAVCDSDWEREFCYYLEKEPRVLSYVKNTGLDFTVPYLQGNERHDYLPDFIVRIGRGNDRTPLNLVVEIKGFRGNDALEKASVMRNCWIPSVNTLGDFGEWQFLELTDSLTMEASFKNFIEKAVAL